ncbi:MAG TPA: hypothetical protein PLI07_15085, partial [Candidatus Hydrogenedentes bacterium]|nr:hypothetical protein [Candidatus Hydrogenedentota bacterium]
RERFRRTMFYQEVDTLPNFEFGYWEETLRTWHDQGLPKDIKDEGAAYDYFGIEHWDMINVNSSPFAVCEHKTLEETDDYLIYQDGYGCVAKINKQGQSPSRISSRSLSKTVRRGNRSRRRSIPTIRDVTSTWTSP